MDGLLSKSFLASIGINLDDDKCTALSQHYEDTLNERVIEQIVEELDENQLNELAHYRNGNAENLQQWLVTNVPQLDEIIEDEIAILLGEIAENSEEI